MSKTVERLQNRWVAHEGRQTGRVVTGRVREVALSPLQTHSPDNTPPTTSMVVIDWRIAAARSPVKSGARARMIRSTAASTIVWLPRVGSVGWSAARESRAASTPGRIAVLTLESLELAADVRKGPSSLSLPTIGRTADRYGSSGVARGTDPGRAAPFRPAWTDCAGDAGAAGITGASTQLPIRRR